MAMAEFFGRNKNLTLTRIFSQDDKTSLKRDLSENGPLRRKLEQHRKQKVY